MIRRLSLSDLLGQKDGIEPLFWAVRVFVAQNELMASIYPGDRVGAKASAIIALHGRGEGAYFGIAAEIFPICASAHHPRSDCGTRDGEGARNWAS